MRNAPVAAEPLSQSNCPNCSVVLEKSAASKGLYLCASCQIPLFNGNLANVFEVLGAPKKFEIDEKALQSRYYELSKILHPDRYTQVMKNGSAARQWIQKISAAANDAYLALKDKETRLEALMEDSGYRFEDATNSGSHNQIPVELADQYFELQELLFEDPMRAKEVAASFRSEVSIKSDSLTDRIYEIAQKMRWPTNTDSLTEIIELRRKRSYLISMLKNLERLGV